MADESAEQSDLANATDTICEALKSLLEAAVGGDAEASETLRQLIRETERIITATINGKRYSTLTCSLPHHSHVLGISNAICKSNSNHIFCKRHKLDCCVICGSDLK